MASILVIALTLICGLAVVIMWQAISLVGEILRETLEYLFRFDEN